MIPRVLPITSRCGEPPNCWLAPQDPSRNDVTVSNSRCIKTSIVMITYSAIAGSWPNTLQTVTPFGIASRSIWSRPAATDCNRRSRGAGGKPSRQIWPTTISASASNGAKRTMSLSSARILVSSGVFTLARMRGATEAAKFPRKSAFMCNPSHRLSFLTAAVEGGDESVPQHALWQQPRLFDQSQRQLGVGGVVREFDHAFAERRLAGGGAGRAVRRIVDDVVFGAPQLLHAA